MPNYCDYEMKIKGTKKNCEEWLLRMNDYEKELTLNGDYKVYQDGYLVSTNYKKYYSMSGEEFYKR